jgi:hypothetical protein
MAEKYAISTDEINHDFADSVLSSIPFIHTPDLDPVTYLDLGTGGALFKKAQRSLSHRLRPDLSYVQGTPEEDAPPTGSNVN